MHGDSLVGDSPITDLDRDERPSRAVALEPQQRAVLVAIIAAVMVAIAAPYPPTKFFLGFALALYWIKLLFELDERFVGMFVLILPTLQLVPLEALGVPGLNWQTIFLIVFVAAAVSADSPPVRSAVSGWIAYFSILVVLGALYTWLTVQSPLWPLLVIAKNWLFPFSLFLLGRRLVRRQGQLWFLMLCVAVASLGLALHGLRDGVTAGNLLTNRPSGLLTQQPNLFGGFLGMHALLCLFVARSRELTWMERSFLVGAAFVMVLTLVFTLSRGAWLAFGLAAVMVGALTNRSAVLALVVFVFIGSRWAPEEATQRANRTLAALEESRDSSLEEALDNSTALRVLQWETFPALLRDSPLWGTGVGTYPQRLEQHTGISRGAHATIVQIGTEMGLLGLLGYLGLFGSIALACLSRARRAASATFHHAAGLGLLAATACLFLADFSGTRFPTHTVTTYYWLLLGAFLGSTDSVSAPPPSDDHTEPGWAAA